jgi:hypothetical protein
MNSEPPCSNNRHIAAGSPTYDKSRMVRLILPPLYEVMDEMASTPHPAQGGTSDPLSVWVPAVHLYPFSRVACELLDEEALPPHAAAEEAHIHSTGIRGTLRPLADFVSDSRGEEDHDTGSDGTGSEDLQIDISLAQVVRIPLSSSLDADRHKGPEEALSTSICQKVSELFQFCFEAFLQYQLQAQAQYFTSISTLRIDDGSGDKPSAPQASPHANNTTDPASLLRSALHQSMNRIFLVPSLEEESFTSSAVPFTMMYTLAVLEVLDCPLLSDALANTIVDLATATQSSAHNDSCLVQQMMARLLLL